MTSSFVSQVRCIRKLCQGIRTENFKVRYNFTLMILFIHLKNKHIYTFKKIIVSHAIKEDINGYFRDYLGSEIVEKFHLIITFLTDCY